MRKCFNIACVPGDGVGPELMKIALDTLKVLLKKQKKINLNFINCDVGYNNWKTTGDYIQEHRRKFGGISEETINKIINTDAMLYIATSGAEFPKEFTTPFPVLRRRFKVFANVRPAKSYPNTPYLKEDIDLILIREQTEGMWMGKEIIKEPGVIEAIAKITKKATIKVARFAFHMARNRNKRKKVTCVHKDNVLRLAFGQFVEGCEEVSKDFPDIIFEKIHTDVLPYELIRKPEQFDVILTTNMYGDIISGEIAAISGGLGICPSGEFGENYAIFRPVHGSAPDLAGKNEANPVATLFSTVMMLRWLGDKNYIETLYNLANILEKSIITVLEDGEVLTKDLGGKSKSTELAKEVWKNVKIF